MDTDKLIPAVVGGVAGVGVFAYLYTEGYLYKWFGVLRPASIPATNTTPNVAPVSQSDTVYKTVDDYSSEAYPPIGNNWIKISGYEAYLNKATRVVADKTDGSLFIWSSYQTAIDYYSIDVIGSQYNQDLADKLQAQVDAISGGL